MGKKMVLELEKKTPSFIQKSLLIVEVKVVRKQAEELQIMMQEIKLIEEKRGREMIIIGGKEVEVNARVIGQKETGIGIEIAIEIETTENPKRTTIATPPPLKSPTPPTATNTTEHDTTQEEPKPLQKPPRKIEKSKKG